MTGGPVRAAIYTRISLDKTGEGQGVERQRTACLALATSRGWTVDEQHVYTENDTSATTGKRPQFAAMLKAAEHGQFDVIVALEVDRLTRKLTELEALIELSERSGVKLATVSGDLDLSTDSGRLVGRILAAVARGEVERKGKRQRAANRQRAEQGRPPHTGRAYGYRLDGSIDDREADMVRGAFSRFAAGATIHSITRWLNDSGAMNTKGRPWDRTSVRDLLLNPRYIGERWHMHHDPQNREYVGPGDWPPLIDEAVFRAAGAILNDPTRTFGPGNARKYLGAGLFRCGICADGTRVRTNYGSKKTKDGTYSKYRAYACQGHLLRRADYVDEVVNAVIAARLRDPRFVTAMAGETDNRDAGRLRDRANELRLARRRVEQDYDDDLISARDLNRKRDRIDAQLSEVAAQFARIGARSALATVLTASDPGAVWLALDDVAARAFVLDAVAVVTVHPAGPGRRPSDRNSEKVSAWERRITSTIVVDWR